MLPFGSSFSLGFCFTKATGLTAVSYGTRLQLLREGSEVETSFPFFVQLLLCFSSR